MARAGEGVVADSGPSPDSASVRFLFAGWGTVFCPHQMSAGLHLSQRLSQQMVLSPQLQQSLALLQAPVLELKAMVEQELQQNPVL